MIKVFSSGKTIRLIADQRLYARSTGSIMVTIGSQEEMTIAYNDLIIKKELKVLFFYNPNLDFLFDCFKSMFRLIEAAGGLVENANGEFLFIFRNGKWDLPKGKIEKGEKVKEAAIREVEEECGIKGLTIVSELKPTYHTYYLEEKLVLKPTYWYKMMCSDVSNLVPQTEEGITDVRWIAKKDFKMIKENTFPSILDVLTSKS